MFSIFFSLFWPYLPSELQAPYIDFTAIGKQKKKRKFPPLHFFLLERKNILWKVPVDFSLKVLSIFIVKIGSYTFSLPRCKKWLGSKGVTPLAL